MRFGNSSEDDPDRARFVIVFDREGSANRRWGLVIKRIKNRPVRQSRAPQ